MRVTFKQFLLEEESNPRTSSISLDEARELIDDYCSSWSKKFSQGKTMFYRGGNYSSVAKLGNSNTGRERKSANTSNYFTLWHDNDPAWKKYPKRSRSFIGTTSVFTAENYGEPYLMIPYDSANIAVMPTEDLFTSFEGMDPNKDHTHSGGDLRIFNNWIDRIIEYNEMAYPTSYDDMVRTWKKITKEMAIGTKGDHWDIDDKKVAESVFRESGAANMYEVWKKIFTPKYVKQFRVKDALISGMNNKEIYVQGKVVFLDRRDKDVQSLAKGRGWNLDD